MIKLQLKENFQFPDYMINKNFNLNIFNLVSLRAIFIIAIAIKIFNANFIYSAAFENCGESARSQSMGSAFTGLADDLNAVKFNPAGLRNLQNTELTAGYGKLLVGLKDNSDIVSSFFAVGQPLRRGKLGTVGISYSELNLTNYYKEDALSFTYARNFFRYFSVGFTMKRYHRSVELDQYTVIDPIFKKYGNSLSAYGYDFGIIYKPGKKYSLGFAVKDLNSPNIGLASEDRIPPEYRLGIALSQKTYNYTLDLSKKDKNLNYNLGAERWFLDHYAMRGGLDFGSHDKHNLAMGFGYRYGSFQFDYSFILPLSGIQGSAGSHNLSLTFKFGKRSIRLEAVEKLEEKAAEGEPISDDIRMLLAEINRLRQEVKYATGLKLKQEITSAEEKMMMINDFLKELERMKLSAVAESQKSSKEINKVSSQTVVPASIQKTIQSKESDVKEIKSEMKWKIYIVRPEDSLQSIAKEFLGNASAWVEIYKVNQDRIERGGVMKPGTVLIIPPVQNDKN